MFFKSLISLALLLWPATLMAEGRFALVLGNSSYINVPNLDNPRNDAGDVASAFRDLGYTVTDAYDLKFTEMNAALRSFRRSIVGADHAIIYFAGHGLELNGRNFLIPVDAELKNDFDVVYEAIPLDAVVQAASSANNLSLVILDACRDNPFLAQMTRGTTTRNFTRGLASYAPQGNSLVAYAARDGAVALDGNGRNSPYASAILSTIDQPGLEISRFFRLVRDKVLQSTGGFQEPFVYGSLSAKAIYFSPPVDTVQPAVIPAPAPKPPAPELSYDGSALDLAFWNAIKNSQNPQDFDDYLTQFPNGVFRPLAERKLVEFANGAPGDNPTGEANSPQVAAVAPDAPATLLDDPDARAIKLAPQSAEGQSAALQPQVQVPAAPQPAAPQTTPAPQVVVPLTTEPLAVQPQFIATRDLIRDSQARLNIIGFDAGPEDGLPGPRTERAIAGFQTSRSIPATGSLDQPTVAALGVAISEPQLQAYRSAKAAAAKPRVTTPRRKTTTTTRTAPAKPTPTTVKRKTPTTVKSVDSSVFGSKKTNRSNTTSSGGTTIFSGNSSGASDDGLGGVFD